MIVYQYEKGYLQSTPLSSRAVNAKRGLFTRARGVLDVTATLSVLTARPAQITRVLSRAKALPPPSPFDAVVLSNGKHEVELSFEELREAWEFVQRLEEAEARLSFNAKLKPSAE